MGIETYRTWLIRAAFTAAVTLAAPSLAVAQDGGGEASEADAGEGGGEEQGGSLQRSNRMEFDARLIRGETAGSGAVFLFQRAPRALPSMVPLRKSYLQGTVDEVLGEGWAEQENEAAQGTSGERKSQSSRKKATSSAVKKNKAKRGSSKKRSRRSSRKR